MIDIYKGEAEDNWKLRYCGHVLVATGGAISEQRITFIQSMGKSQVIQCIATKRWYCEIPLKGADILKYILPKIFDEQMVYSLYSENLVFSEDFT